MMELIVRHGIGSGPKKGDILNADMEATLQFKIIAVGPTNEIAVSEKVQETLVTVIPIYNNIRA